MRGLHNFGGSPRARRATRNVALLSVGGLLLALTQVAAQAELPGSNFESNDGNLIAQGTAPAGGLDWANAPNRQAGVEQFSGALDNSFGQGTKEDDLTPSVVDGSIPPQKSDLTRFYVANDQAANGDKFLYLAWERTNTLGSANMDFEINQLAQPDLTTKGTKTVNRTSGDLLVLFDFSGGGTVATLSLVKWLTGTETGADGAATAADCKASNALPCWGAQPTDDSLDPANDNTIDLSVAGIADGAVNVLCGGAKKCTDTTLDPVADPDIDLASATFGEAGINLSAAGVFPAGACRNFGSAYLKSRSSDSFTAETKDFVAPVSININNCGNLIVKKITVGGQGTFDFTTTTLAGGNFSLTTTAPGEAGSDSKTYSGILAGTYDVAETVPSGWSLTSATCTNGTPAAVVVVVGQTTTCTFTNTAKATLIVEKQTLPDGSAASFEFTEGAGLDNSGTFNLSDGQTASYVDILPGQYTVTETEKTGWMFPPTIVCDDANSSGTGAVATYNLEAGETVKCTFTNTEKAKVTITKNDDDSPAQAVNGAVFSIYEDKLPLSAASPGAEDTGAAAVATCTIVAGTCSTGKVLDPSKFYWVVETTTPVGYTTAQPQRIDPSPGENVSLTFVDPRQFKVITIVCKIADNSLYQSSVTLGGETKNSLSAGTNGLTAAQLCGISDGAVFSPKVYGNYAGSVSIPQ